MGFVTLGCKEFLFHSNPLSFLKGVDRVTARPPPIHENWAHNEGGPIEYCSIILGKKTKQNKNHCRNNKWPFEILLQSHVITTKQDPVFWCTYSSKEGASAETICKECQCEKRVEKCNETIWTETNTCHWRNERSQPLVSWIWSWVSSAFSPMYVAHYHNKPRGHIGLHWGLPVDVSPIMCYG